MIKKIILISIIPAIALADDNAELAEKISTHQSGARDLSDEQDILAADVQQLTIEQTNPEVIALFREVEEAMDDASERLYDHDTGGVTIAAETEVIEKIFEAAKKKQQCQGGDCSKPGSAMLDMMERMMGKEPGQGQKPGQKPGDQGGEGQTGDSSKDNSEVNGTTGDGSKEERTVPKGAGLAGKELPQEFRDALKAYNKGAEKLVR